MHSFCAVFFSLIIGHRSRPRFWLCHSHELSRGMELRFRPAGTRYGSQLASRSMFTYGFTPFLQLSFTTPAILTNTHANLPLTMMSGGDYFQSNLSWRFQHQAKSIGRRVETTAFAGLVALGPQAGAGPMSTIARAPGFNAGVVTGLASRSHYLWLGGAYTSFIERDSSRMPSTVSYSLVYGFRPRSLRKAWR